MSRRKSRRKVILASQTTLTRHAIQQVDFDLIRKFNMDLEIWDCTLLMDEMRNRPRDISDSSNIQIRLRGHEDLSARVSELGSKDVVIFRGGTYPHQIQQESSLYQIVAQSQATMGTLDVGQIPANLPRNHDLRSFVFKAGRRVQDLCLSWATNSEERKKETFSLGVKPTPNLSIRHLDYVWSGPFQTSASTYASGTSTAVRLMHTFDYEAIVRALSPSRPWTRSVVLLDSMGPGHPDHQSGEASRYKLSQTEHDTMVISLVGDLSRRLKAVPIVSCHPRSSAKMTQERFPDFHVRAGMTPRLVSEATLIIDVAGSTAVGQAATARRPLLMITDKRLPTVTQRLQADMSYWSGYRRLSTQDAFETPIRDLLKIPNTRRYVETFMCHRNPHQSKLWRQILQDISTVE